MIDIFKLNLQNIKKKRKYNIAEILIWKNILLALITVVLSTWHDHIIHKHIVRIYFVCIVYRECQSSVIIF